MFVSFALTAAAALWIAYFVALAVESRIFDRVVRRWKFRTKLGRCVVALVVVGLIAYAGTKPDSSGGRRGVARRALGLRSAPFSLAAVGVNETFDFAPPEGATVATNWLQHGASTQPIRLSFVDWVFPFADVGYSNFTVFASGEVMPGEIGTNSFLKPFAATLGIVPQANWSLLSADGGFPSLFWHQLTPSNTLLLTWHNALLDRQTNSPVSFQAELKPSGGFMFRYDLSRLAADGSLTNAVVAVRAGDTSFVDEPTTNLTSLTFRAHDEEVCDEGRRDFDEKVGDEDPFAFPEGSTNTVFEHVFYSGSTNGAFARPQPTGESAVLTVTVSGYGSGELLVGPTFVPLCGRTASARGARLSEIPPTVLAVSVPRGSTQKVYLRGDSTLSVSLDSDDFAFGSLPDLSGRCFTGWINFPYVDATVPCIHDYTARRKEVTLRAGDDAADLTCEWSSSGKIRVENRPPRSALLTGLFDGRETEPVSYTLTHPLHLFGQSTFAQTARYCPPPPEEEEDASDPERPHWPHDPYGEPHEPENPGGPDSEDPPPEDDPSEGDPSPEVPEEPEDYDEASSQPHLTGVLRLRSWPEALNSAVTNRLVVPSEYRNCCPCPDHATNWVGVVSKSDRLLALDENGEEFQRSGETVDVRVIGVAPSVEPFDAQLVFAANGEVCKEFGYTVFGVGFEDERLDRVNGINSTFGLPITVGTNEWNATTFGLRTRVGLACGNVHVGFEGATAPFAVWVCDSLTGEYVQLASSDGEPLDISLADWRFLSGVSPSDADFWTPVIITATAPGSATLVFRYWAVIDGKFAEDEARQVVTAVAPPVRVDVDRDNDIDEADAQRLADGAIFRFWCNDDTDKGDYIGQSDDTTPNAGNLKVDGKLDLVNFFPVQIDVSAFRQAWGNGASFRIRAPRSSGLWHCAVVNGLSPDAPDALQTEPQTVVGGVALDSADLVELDWAGLDLGDVLRPDGTAMLVFEATRPAQCDDGPELVVSLGGIEVFACRLAAEISHVDDMYRYLGLRGAESDASFVPMLPGMPANMPDDETDGRHFVFVHGYNVNAAQSRVWARAMFKRLWWAGSKSKFTAVDWFGDDSQIPVPVVGDVSPNYYINVEHAFMTAEALKNACDALPGEKVMMAHSLGNMLVSAAAKDFNLQYSKYYMLNAAVPMEAYDASSQSGLMVDGAWKDMDASFRASRWSEQFESTPYEGDFRKYLSWKGRFAGIHDAVNCYSPTEDILQNPSVLKVLGMTVGETTGGIWSNQELFKGCAAWYGINSVTFAGTRIEGGWGINANYVANPLAYIPLAGFNASYFANYTREDLITSPLFTSFNDSRMSSTNALNIVDYRLRAKMLGDAIPAESFAAGANPVSGLSGNYNYQNEDGTPNGWPRWKGDIPQWHHSDIKDIAYFYVWKLFERIKEGN